MSCATCGAALRPGAMFCGECGSRVEGPLAATSSGAAGSAGSSADAVASGAPSATTPPPPPAVTPPTVPPPPAPPQPTEPLPRLIENLPLGLLEQSAPPPAAASLQAPTPGALPTPAPSVAPVPPRVETTPPPPPVSDPTAPPVAPAAAAAPAPVPTSVHPADVSDSAPAPVVLAEAPVAASDHAAAAEPGTDDDWDETVMSPRRQIAWRIVTASGDRHPIREATIIGRSPTARDGAGALALMDATKSMSKSHALFDVGPDGLWVEDLGSTNGTIVHDGSVEVELAAGQRQTLTEGASLELGEYILTIVHD